ncbi:hypothetical protein, partial [Mesorhizobium sp. M7A.F.Ca.MR.148.00.0.0]|uniref:hypothetical protein n=1 Tax=Mesorhizobium sp. M7A.F.Ca.MR.148.00.0.0 TaxID=2496775 RepID=UPI0019D0BD04
LGRTLGFAFLVEQSRHREIGIGNEPIANDGLDQIRFRQPHFYCDAGQRFPNAGIEIDAVGVSNYQRGASKHDLKISARNVCDAVGRLLQFIGERRAGH